MKEPVDNYIDISSEDKNTPNFAKGHETEEQRRKR
jgi:hypothetical protein